MIKGGRPSATKRAAVIVLAALAILPPAALATDEEDEHDHYEFVLKGAAGGPAWWTAVPETGSDATRRFTVGPLDANVVVRVVGVAESSGSSLHLYRYAEGENPREPPPMQDAFPSGHKSVTVAGPGTFTVLVDPGPSTAYTIRTTFDGYYGDSAYGARANFTMADRGAYRCPTGAPSACPP